MTGISGRNQRDMNVVERGDSREHPPELVVGVRSDALDCRGRPQRRFPRCEGRGSGGDRDEPARGDACPAARSSGAPSDSGLPIKHCSGTRKKMAAWRVALPSSPLDSGGVLWTRGYALGKESRREPGSYDPRGRGASAGNSAGIEGARRIVFIAQGPASTQVNDGHANARRPAASTNEPRTPNFVPFATRSHSRAAGAAIRPILGPGEMARDVAARPEPDPEGSEKEAASALGSARPGVRGSPDRRFLAAGMPYQVDSHSSCSRDYNAS
jgi:hypothetical protein